MLFFGGLGRGRRERTVRQWNLQWNGEFSLEENWQRFFKVPLHQISWGNAWHCCNDRFCIPPQPHLQKKGTSRVDSPWLILRILSSLPFLDFVQDTFCGQGMLTLAFLHHHPDLRLISIDRSKPALQQLQENLKLGAFQNPAVMVFFLFRCVPWFTDFLLNTGINKHSY